MLEIYFFDIELIPSTKPQKKKIYGTHASMLSQDIWKSHFGILWCSFRCAILSKCMYKNGPAFLCNIIFLYWNPCILMYFLRAPGPSLCRPLIFSNGKLWCHSIINTPLVFVPWKRTNVLTFHCSAKHQRMSEHYCSYNMVFHPKSSAVEQ